MVLQEKKTARVGELPQSLALSSQFLPALEPKRHAGLVSQIALVVVAAGESGAKAGEQVIDLYWSKGNRFGDRNVESSADEKIKGVVARRRACGNASQGTTTRSEDIPIKVGMRSAE